MFWSGGEGWGEAEGQEAGWDKQRGRRLLPLDPGRARCSEVGAISKRRGQFLSWIRGQRTGWALPQVFKILVICSTTRVKRRSSKDLQVQGVDQPKTNRRSDEHRWHALWHAPDGLKLVRSVQLYLSSRRGTALRRRNSASKRLQERAGVGPGRKGRGAGGFGELLSNVVDEIFGRTHPLPRWVTRSGAAARRTSIFSSTQPPKPD